MKEMVDVLGVKSAILPDYIEGAVEVLDEA